MHTTISFCANAMNAFARRVKAGPAIIEALDESDTVVATGQLLVDKARTHLVFRLPPQSLFLDYCNGSWMTWPGANEPENSATVKGLLQTNNTEGALSYHGQRHYVPFHDLAARFWEWALRDIGYPFNNAYNYLFMTAISAESLPYTVYVEQLESENYYGARTEASIYWANTNLTQCSQ